MAEKVNPETDPNLSGGVLLVNDQGDIVSTQPYGSESAKAMVRGQQVYQQSDGSYSAKLPQAYAEFNKQTGKLTINAPQVLVDTKAFQENILNNATVKQMTKAYKVDPNYSYPDPEDDTKTISLNDILGELNTSLEEYTKSAQSLIDERERRIAEEESSARSSSILGLGTSIKTLNHDPARWRKLSLDDLTVAFSYAQNATDAQRIPALLLEQGGSLVEGDAIKKLASWNENTQSVTKEDLLKYWWSLDAQEREGILAKYGYVDSYLKYSDFSDPEDAAAFVSFKAFLDENDPFATTAKGINRKTREIVGAELQSATFSLVSGLESFMSGALGLVAAPFGGEYSTLGQGAKALAGQAAQLEGYVENLNDEAAIVSNAAGVVGDVFQMAGNLGAILIAEGAVTELMAPAVKKMENLADLLEYADNNEANIKKGLDFIFKANPSKITVDVAKMAAGLIRSSIPVVKFFAEVVTDAAVDSPHTMAAIMGSEDVSDDVKNTLMTEAAYNGIGLAAGFTISKGLMKASTTKIGKAINAGLAKFNAKVSTNAGDILYKVRSKIAGAPLEEALAGKAETALEKGEFSRAYKYRRMQETIAAQNQMREARKILAGLPVKDTDAIMEQIEKIQTLDAMYDLAANGSKNTLGAIVASDPVIRASDEAVTDALQKAIKQQSAAGFVARTSKYGSSGLSEVGSQYVSLSQRISIAQRALQDTNSSLYSAAQTALPVYQKQMAALVESMPADYRAALDIYTQKLKTFYADMTDYAVSEGLLSEELIEGYRKNPLFADNNYMRVLVEEDVQKIKMQRVDGLIQEKNLLDIKHLSLPDKVQTFVDPEVTRYWYGLEIAKSYNAQRLAEAALEATGATPTVLASNAEIKIARDVTINAKEVSDAASRHFKSFVDDVDSNLTLKTVKNLKEARQEVVKGHFKIKGVERKATNVAKQAAIGNLSSDDLAKILKENGYANGSAYDTLALQIGEGLSAGNAKTVFNEWYGETPTEFRSWLRNQRNIALGAKEGEQVGSARVTLEQFQELQAQQTFRRAFDEQTVFTNKTMRDSKQIVDAAKKVEESNEFLEELTEAKKSIPGLTEEQKANVKEFRKNFKDVKNILRNSLDTYIDDMAKEGKVINSVKAISEYGQGDAEDITRYLALRELNKSPNRTTIKNAISKNIEKQLPNSASKSEIKAYKNATDQAIDALLTQEYNNARLALDGVNSKIIDKKEWAEEIKSLQKKISDTRTMQNVIKMTDGNGGIQLAEVSPNLAFLYNYRPRRVVDTNLLSRANQLTSRLFRFGTTTVSAKSFVNQLFRDSGNAFMMGNAWRSISESADNLVDVFGESIVNEIKNFDPSRYEKLVRSVEQAGLEATTENLARAEVQNIEAAGKALSPASTSTELYSRVGRSDNEVFERMQQGARGAADKLDSIFNGKREEYLRQRVFMNNLNNALENGYSYQQARNIALNMMQNATTNFSRSIFWLDSIAENVPYIRASINGTTSFYRMFSLDPVGVIGRMAGGVFVPYTYLLGQSLADSENAKIYAQIPEYEKRDSLVIVVRGQKISIPMPQELAPIMAPFRHFIEYLYDAQPNNFWDLLGNDILGLSPVDLTGFSKVDMNVMTEDPTIMDRLNRGTMRLVSQLAPIPVKAAWIYATGVDPYSGKRIANTSYTYYDLETGEEIPMGYKQGKFAEALASAVNHDNPAIISKVISSIFGVTGEDALDTITGIVQAVIPGGEEGEDPVKSVVNNLLLPQLENASSALYNESYDRINSLWRQSVQVLEAKKDAITESKEWKDLETAMSRATTPEALAKLRAQRQDMIDDYIKEVTDTAKRLISEYGGVFDKYKMSAVIQLLNFSTNADFDLSNQYLQDLSSDVYYAGRGQAIRTMYEMGVQGTTDYSLFGYLSYNRQTKETTIKYSKPTAILDAANIVWGAENIEMANLKATLDAAGITRGKMFEGYYQATTKAEQKAYKANWNKQVMRALAPYIQSVGVDEVLNNTNITDYLDNIIFVDNLYKAKDYIKKLFGGD